jgi:hypothetical protein
MNLDLHDLCDAVSDEESFLAFLDVLRAEVAARAPGMSAAELLGRAVGWARSHPAALDDQQHARDGSAAPSPPANPWHRAARSLFAGFVDMINET